MPEHFQRGSSVAKQKHNRFRNALLALLHNLTYCAVNGCVCVCKRNIHYVSANENNEKSMFERLAKDYYHRDNKWCCCYEIKCSHNRMESSAKQK